MADHADQAEMARLTLAGLSRDQRRLLLVDEHGTTFSLDVTPDLRAAVRGETTRLGQLEIKMSSSIRPREIQTRIRAGETPETVAQAAGTTVEAIMPYVAPVLAERQHLAGRAQRASVRRAPSEGGAATTQTRALGDAVEGHLRGLGADPTQVEWDAYRRETGRWVLSAGFEADARSGTARFTYDAPGNYVLCDNDDARWLIGEAVLTPEPAPARDDLQQVRERRLASVPEELPLGDSVASVPGAATALGEDAIDLVTEEEPAPAPAPASATAASSESEQGEEADQGDEARHRRPVQKKRGRASVPSWDEIMFGGSDQA